MIRLVMFARSAQIENTNTQDRTIFKGMTKPRWKWVNVNNTILTHETDMLECITWIRIKTIHSSEKCSHRDQKVQAEADGGVVAPRSLALY